MAAFLGGFIAGEGYFGRHGGTFHCAVAVGAADGAMCELLREFLRVGRVRRYPRRRDHYDDEVVWSAKSLRELLDVMVPFLDEHLPPSYKRDQYLRWRAELFDYWQRSAKRRRSCTIPGCDSPRRAKGLCRRHYYVAYRRLLHRI
jgi:hypothetical protein